MIKLANVAVTKSAGTNIGFLSRVPISCYINDAWRPVGEAFQFKDGKYIKANFHFYVDFDFENKYPYAVIESNIINSIMLMDDCLPEMITYFTTYFITYFTIPNIELRTDLLFSII